MSQGSVSSHSFQSGTNKAPLLIEVDTGSSPSLDLRPSNLARGISPMTRSRHILVVKELNWTTYESSKADDTLDPWGASPVFVEGSLNNPEREAEASVESVERPAIPLACENLDSIMTPARL